MHEIYVIASGESSTITSELFPDQQYTITETTKKEDSVCEIEALQPSLIAIEFSEDSYEATIHLCKKIKKKKKIRHIPLIIAGTSISLANSQQALEIGCVDVFDLSKSDALREARIKSHINTTDHYKALEKKLKAAKESAFLAMSDSKHLGEIIQFLDKSHDADNFNSLAEYCFKMFESLDLNVSFCFHDTTKNYFFSPIGNKGKYEKAIMTRMRDKTSANKLKGNRFITFGDKIASNYYNVSIIVFSIPDDDIEKGRVRDILGAILNAIDSRFIQVQQKQREREWSKNSQRVLDVVSDSLKSIELMFKSHESSTTSIMDELTVNVNEALSLLGLTLEQEELMLKIIENAMNAIFGLYSEGIEIENHFQNIINVIEDHSSFKDTSRGEG